MRHLDGMTSATMVELGFVKETPGESTQALQDRCDGVEAVLKHGDVKLAGRPAQLHAAVGASFHQKPRGKLSCYKTQDLTQSSGGHN